MKFQGILFFPVTPFAEDGSVDEQLLARHIRRGVESGAGGVFVACGTGEFHALSPAEVGACARVAVAAAGGRVPVVAAAGGPLPLVRQQVERLAEAGVDGLLLLPPYLVNGPQPGLVDYVRAVTSAGPLPVIVYQRANAVPTPETAVELAQLPGVVGLKDGVGDIELMHRTVRGVRRAAGADFQFFNGLPTAEMTVHAYRGLGVPLYSSAVFAFAPEIALAFHRAVGEGDEETAGLLLDEFYVPLVRLRNERPGYAVSLVKAGVRLRGLPVGGVRAPLLDPTQDHLNRLAELLEHGLRLVPA
ncbi:5-dehydro-4-deoxyglucarate dehydratase [Streptomyces litchfieldiae]|uniref:Probable 5-dehydro-4-deoxyglucarate dehydratase n=1 Tax=Streptomyces litchfieldiae TaxID=3075543 RepID=A0ABU2MUF6_9ACTN|nr:5-dehydro-4-deoxyglucarate dehydratase [Streptomyces sp. DSM 44938]MDT0344199.1 5-dehydro-4-deoxyglucarate dehydratase [Streptomyces sp. DSM 44938]